MTLSWNKTKYLVLVISLITKKIICKGIQSQLVNSKKVGRKSVVQGNKLDQLLKNGRAELQGCRRLSHMAKKLNFYLPWMLQEEKVNSENSKSLHIRSYSGPHFPAFGLNNSEYGHFLSKVDGSKDVKEFNSLIFLMGAIIWDGSLLHLISQLHEWVSYLRLKSSFVFVRCASAEFPKE